MTRGHQLNSTWGYEWTSGMRGNNSSLGNGNRSVLTEDLGLMLVLSDIYPRGSIELEGDIWAKP